MTSILSEDFSGTDGEESEFDRVARTQLESVDWDFLVRTKSHPIENIHPYPAKFISDIPHALIQSLGCRKGTSVLDPFAGSGTTLMEAQRRGYRSIGIDVNPIACLLSRVKTSPSPRNFLDRAREVCSAAQRHDCAVVQLIPNVDHWFKQGIQEAIGSLVNEIDAISSGTTQDALRLALSSIVVRVSNQDCDTRYAAVEKNIEKPDVFRLFMNACEKLNQALAQRDWNLVPSSVIEADTLSLRAADIPSPVGLIVTSPPYPNAYEYWLYHKYRMWWLGFNPLSVKEREIGARAHFFKKHHHTEETFRDQMRQTFRLLDGVLVRKGHACFVVGRSKIHGRIIDNAKILREIADEFGMCLLSRCERVIASSRKSFNLSHANIKTETILVFQKSRD